MFAPSQPSGSTSPIVKILIVIVVLGLVVYFAWPRLTITEGGKTTTIMLGLSKTSKEGAGRSSSMMCAIM